MAEYIDKFLVLAGLNLRLLRLKNEYENVDKIAELENIRRAISETETADVVERAEYELIRKQLSQAFDRIAELDKLNGELHSKIDKAIAEIEQLDFIRGENEIFVNKDFVLEIIKRNIGE